MKKQNFLKKIFMAVMVVGFVLSFSFASTSIVGAEPPATASKCKVSKGSIFEKVCTAEGSGASAIDSMWSVVIKTAAGLVMIAIVGGIVFGGLTYARSNGDPGVAKSGMEMVRNSVIALLLYIVMFAFLNFLVPGLLT